MFDYGNMENRGYLDANITINSDCLSCKFNWDNKRQYTVELSTDAKDVYKNGKVTTLNVIVRKYNFDTADKISIVDSKIEINNLSEKWLVGTLRNLSKSDKKMELPNSRKDIKKAITPKEYDDDRY